MTNGLPWAKLGPHLVTNGGTCKPMGSCVAASTGPTSWVSMGWACERAVLGGNISPFKEMGRHNWGPLGVALLGTILCEVDLPRAVQFPNQFF